MPNIAKKCASVTGCGSPMTSEQLITIANLAIPTNNTPKKIRPHQWQQVFNYSPQAKDMRCEKKHIELKISGKMGVFTAIPKSAPTSTHQHSVSLSKLNVFREIEALRALTQSPTTRLKRSFDSMITEIPKDVSPLKKVASTGLKTTA